MKRQGRQAEAFCTAPDPDTAAALIFGKPGAPLDEFSETLVRNWQKASKDPLDIKRVSYEDAKQEPGMIVDGLYSASLFGGANLFIATISRETEAAPFLEAVAEIESRGQMPDGRLLVLAGDLTTRSKTRKTFEGAKHATALHFFERTEREFENWVKTWLDTHSVRLEPDALQSLIASLQDDQSLAPSELSKLELFAADRDEPLSRADVANLIALEDQSSHFELVDLALDGRAADVGRLLPKLSLEPVAIPILIGLVNQLKRLSQAHEIASQGVTGPRIGDKLTPRIFERQWAPFERRMQIWHPPRIINLLSRIHEVDAECRQAASPQEALVGQLLLDISRVGQAVRR